MNKKAKETPMGASQWKEYGIKYGYYDYFKKEEVVVDIEFTTTRIILFWIIRLTSV